MDEKENPDTVPELESGSADEKHEGFVVDHLADILKKPIPTHSPESSHDEPPTISHESSSATHSNKYDNTAKKTLYELTNYKGELTFEQTKDLNARIAKARLASTEAQKTPVWFSSKKKRYQK